MKHGLRASLVLAAALAGGALAGGCETTVLFPGDPEEQTPDDLEWQESEPVAAPSLDLVWQRCRATCEVLGYDVDDERTRFDRRELVTRWMTTLGRNRFEGQRRRAFVRIVPSGDRWILRCAVVRQRNADMDDPTNPAQAQWEPAGPDTSRTGILLFRIRAGLVDDPSE